jgi:hypothetical protein
MNDAHLHLVVNHFHYRNNLGLGTLVAGIVLRNTVKNAFTVYLLLPLFCILAWFTGEGAEEMVEDMPILETNYS